MSKITKSPKKVARAAYKIAKSTLPRYGHRYSPKKFTQPQLFVCLILKIFLKTDYRGIAAILSDSPDLCKSFDLVKVPHFTTLQKASKKLLRFTVADKLIKATVRSVTKSTIDLAAIDSTGLDASYTSRYFVRRRRSKRYNLWEDTIYRRFPKLSIVCDCSNHLILSAITTRGPSVDVNQFRKPLKSAVDKAKMKKLLADAAMTAKLITNTQETFIRSIRSSLPKREGRQTNYPKQNIAEKCEPLR